MSQKHTPPRGSRPRYEPVSMGMGQQSGSGRASAPRASASLASAYKKANSRPAIHKYRIRLFAAPFAIAFVLLAGAFASGKLDKVIVGSRRVALTSFPNQIAESSVPVMRASLETGIPSRESVSFDFSSYRVSKGDSVSRIAHRYGLSPVTLISVNQLDGKSSLTPKTVLIIPYRDGFRVTPQNGEGLTELTERYQTDLIRKIPDTRDYFVSDAVNPYPFSTEEGVFLYPVDGRIITAYGEVTDGLTGIPYRSEGIELAAAEGSPIIATQSGKVVLVGYHASYGRYIILSHAGGWKTFYGHLGDILVAQDQSVEAGFVLGHVGSTGRARSPRLHFAVFSGGEPVDPLDYLY